MVRTAINLYTVRNLDEPTLDVLERIADAGYDGVQFGLGFEDVSLAQIYDALDDLGLDPVPTHTGINALKNDLEGVIDDHRILGVEATVLSLSDECFTSRAATKNTAAELDALDDRLGDHNFSLHYHNHAYEFTDLGDTTGYEAFADASSIGLEIDVGWVHTGGADPVVLIERYGDRVNLLHVKDMSNGDFCDLGEGDVDVPACIEAGRSVGVEWFIYEHDEPADPAASIDHGATFLNDLV